jgi:hypothetical protein
MPPQRFFGEPRMRSMSGYGAGRRDSYSGLAGIIENRAGEFQGNAAKEIGGRALSARLSGRYARMQKYFSGGMHRT